MAVSFLSFHEVSDLCIGKPPLRCLPAAATVGEALLALKRSGEPYISVWTCNHHRHRTSIPAAASEACRCVGKVSIVDVVCFLCREDNLPQPLFALDSPVSVLLPKAPELVNVKHLEPGSSLLEAIDCIIEGAQNLIIPTRSHRTSKNLQLQSNGSLHHAGQQFCWITQEDVVRFLLNSINLFFPLPGCSIESLNLIEEDFLTLQYDDPILHDLSAFKTALTRQMAVAVVDEEGRLIGEISLHTLSFYSETLSAAVATLSAGDLMAYIDSKGPPPDDLVQLVKSKLEERNLEGMLELMEEDVSVVITPSSSIASDSSSSSSDDDTCSLRRSGGSTGLTMNRTEAIACHPESSLAAVMIQALAYRVSYVWVVDPDYCVVGMVSFSGILSILRISPKT